MRHRSTGSLDARRGGRGFDERWRGGFDERWRGGFDERWRGRFDEQWRGSGSLFTRRSGCCFDGRRGGAGAPPAPARSGQQRHGREIRDDDPAPAFGAGKLSDSGRAGRRWCWRLLLRRVPRHAQPQVRIVQVRHGPEICGRLEHHSTRLRLGHRVRVDGRGHGRRMATVDAHDGAALLARHALDARVEMLLPERVWNQQAPFTGRAVDGNWHEPT
jgi:hypothetical protein